MTPRLNEQGDPMLLPKRAGAATVAALMLAGGLGLGPVAAYADETGGTDAGTSQTPGGGTETGGDEGNTGEAGGETGGETGEGGEQEPETPAETTWTAKIDGKDVTLAADENGVLKGTISFDDGIPGKMTVTGSDGTTFDITPTDQHTDATEKVGVVTRTGTMSYAHEKTEATDTEKATPAVDVQATYSKTVGKEITVKDGAAFTLGEDGVWSASMSFTGLNGDRTPTVNEVETSDGEKLPIAWDSTGSVDHASAGVTIHRAGKASGTVKVSEKVGDTTIEHSWDVRVDTTISGGMQWTVDLNGETHRLNVGEDGTQSFVGETAGDYPQDKVEVSSTVDGKAGSKVTLNGDMSQHSSADTDKMGVIRVDGAAGYAQAAQGDESTTGTPAFDIRQPYSYTSGKEVRLSTGEGSDGIPFTLNDQGMWVATAPNATLDTSNKPSVNEVTLSNGDKAQITWDDQTTVVEVPTRDAETTRIVRKNGVATGKLTITDPNTGETREQSYTVNIVADRAEDTHFTIVGINETDSAGNTTLHQIDNFDPNVTDYAITLPHSSVNSAYAIVEEHGVDATYKGESVNLAADAGRVLSIDVNGKTYRVKVQFEAADILADSKAKLDGIYVNLTGETVRGDLIAGWNPNRLDYAITIGEDESAYLLPVSDDPNVRISAGDVTQTAQSSKQTWTVTYLPTGESREYSVTVTRPVNTAVTEFTPEDPIAQDQTEPVESPEDTELTSHGYVNKNGKYVTVDGDEYTIPEGGAFSYQAKAGQSAVASSRHVNAMTYEYTVTVLPQDTSKGTAQHVFTVTYLTAETSKDTLDGIVVDGVPVNGFDPYTSDYTVQVNDPTQWTIVPNYDKTTGMNVTTVKEGADATVTVVSGDGLNTREYHVHADQKPFAGDGTVGVGGNLPQTGTTVFGLLASMIGMVCMGFLGVFTKISSRTRRIQ